MFLYLSTTCYRTLAPISDAVLKRVREHAFGAENESLTDSDSERPYVSIYMLRVSKGDMNLLMKRLESGQCGLIGEISPPTFRINTHQACL